jgi:hypothetical protein
VKTDAKSPRRLQPTEARVKQLPRGIVRGSRNRVYLAAPLGLFGTERHLKALELVRHRFPTHELLDAAELFSDTNDWRRRWPGMVRTLDRLVFITDVGGIIGAGVFQEILDAGLRDVPIEYLSPSGRFVAVRAIRFKLLGEDDPAQFARVHISRGR